MSKTEQVRCWYIPVSLWGVLATYAALLAYPFQEPLIHMVNLWDTKEEYGYGYIIPMITAFLIYQRKEELYSLPFEPTAKAIPLLVLGNALFFIGVVATTYTLSQYAFVLTILALAYGVLGGRAFRIVAMPIALLFFMIPFPAFIYNTLSGNLQLISSQLGVAVIRAFGISVYLEGNVIDLGSYKLQVVEACSGLRYLFPLVSLSFVAAYLYSVELWKRVIVVLSSIPITIMMNSFRIGVIGVLVEYYGIEQAEGFLHDFEGWIIFMACMGILFIEMALLARIGSNKRRLSEVFGLVLPEPVDCSNPCEPQKTGVTHVVFGAFLVMFSLSIHYIGDRPEVELHRKNFEFFPMEIDGWRGHRQTLDAPVLDALKLSDYVIADFTHEHGDLVNFYIAYYATQTAGAAAHSPRACIPGGGWKIESHRVVALENLFIFNQPLSVNRLLIKKGEYGQLVYYWFQQRNRVVTNEYQVKWFLFWDSLTRNRTDGSLVRLTTVIRPNETEEQAETRLMAFLKAVKPVMIQYMPE